MGHKVSSRFTAMLDRDSYGFTQEFWSKVCAVWPHQCMHLGMNDELLEYCEVLERLKHWPE